MTSGRKLLVAASVGPYGAVLADGSEYRGRYGVSPAALRDFHGPRLELLASAGPDLLAVETIPDADEAEVLVSLLDVEDGSGVRLPGLAARDRQVEQLSAADLTHPEMATTTLVARWPAQKWIAACKQRWADRGISHPYGVASTP